MVAPSGTPFPSYLQMPAKLPQWVWHVARVISVGITLGICVLLFLDPPTGLFIFWRVVIPLLPILFFVAPGLWRNVCPLAASNQTPRLLGFTRGLTLPKWLREYYYVIGIALFVAIVATRKVIFNGNGPALSVLVLAILGMAFTGGVLFKGKSGWCGSICPLLPVQRIYGQTPFITIRNSHCRPCVGCTKNCYDFNPRVAYLADLYDEDPHYSAYRKFFVGAFPGLILAFFLVPSPPAISVAEMYAQFGLYMLATVGSFYLLDSFVKVTANKLTALYGAAALNLFYWFNIPLMVSVVVDPAPDWIVWLARGLLLALTAVWVARTYRKESVFVQQVVKGQSLRIGSRSALGAHSEAQQAKPEVTFAPDDKRVVAEEGATLLDVAEGHGVAIEPGCRMGVCGSDPVCIVKGMSNLSPVTNDEKATIERLGLAAGSTRMACSARILGPVTVSLQTERVGASGGSSEGAASSAGSWPLVTGLKVVIIGNGIAGVTAADFVRRYHPECEIHLVGREQFHLYNRMAITRLIYGRSAMQGLFLMPDAWYDDHKITCWLNTRVTRIDRDAKEVLLGTGETLKYDRLILATGSSSTVPPIEGFGKPGSFVLREASDALALRAYAQEHGCRQALVAGGGLLGLEASYALHKLGLHVGVLERGDRLLRRQIDAVGSQLLQDYLRGMGISIITQAEAKSLQGERAVEEVTLKDGRTLPCDLFLVSAGITPNVELASKAGLYAHHGILVDASMRTSDPAIFAAGDAVEFGGQVMGLWPPSVEQAEIAAANATGGDRHYTATTPVTMLKVVGINLTSIGQFEANSPEDIVIAQEDPVQHSYRKLVIRDGKIVGAILIGYPLDAPIVTNAVKQGTDVSMHIEALRAGNWDVLKGAIKPEPAAVA